MVKPFTEMIDTVIIVGKTKEAWLKSESSERSFEKSSPSSCSRKQLSSTIFDTDVAIANKVLVVNLYKGVKLLDSIYYSTMERLFFSLTYSV